MGFQMQSFLRILSVLLITLLLNGLAIAEEDDSPGNLVTGKAVYDAKRFAMLTPASLFDKDNSPSVFRLGMVWDERYGDEVRLIVTFPITGEVSMDDLQKSAGSFVITVDGKQQKTEKVKGSIILRQKTRVFSKEYEAEIRYQGSRELLQALLKSKQAGFSYILLTKTFATELRVTDKARAHYHDAEYTAINGLNRFYKAAWGELQ